MLVTKTSATHCRPWEDEADHVCAMSRDHSDMVRFSPNDNEYSKVRVTLLRLARRAAEKQQQQQQKPWSQVRVDQHELPVPVHGMNQLRLLPAPEETGQPLEMYFDAQDSGKRSLRPPMR